MLQWEVQNGGEIDPNLQEGYVDAMEVDTLSISIKITNQLILF